MVGSEVVILGVNFRPRYIIGNLNQNKELRQSRSRLLNETSALHFVLCFIYACTGCAHLQVGDYKGCVVISVIQEQ